MSKTGWAYRNSKGQIILDNDFERIPSRSSLNLDEDGYTIIGYKEI